MIVNDYSVLFYDVLHIQEKPGYSGYYLSAQYLQNFIKNYADRLRLEGFNVINIQDDDAQMPSFNGVKPSIYARDESLERIIVVKTEQEYENSVADLEKLKEYTREHQLASYWGFITSETSWRLEENII